MLQERKASGKLLTARMKQEYQIMFGTGLGYGPDLDVHIAELPKKKTGRYSLRSHFVKTLYDYIQEYSQKYSILLKNNVLDEDKAYRLAFLAELIIDCQYYENYIFDGKNGVTTPDEIRRYLNAAMLLKSEIFAYIRQHFQDEHGTAEKVRACVDDIFNAVNAGQQMEADWCRYKNFKEGIKAMPAFGPRIMEKSDPTLRREIRDVLLKGTGIGEDKVRFMEVYILRLYMVSCQLFIGFSDLMAELCGLPTNHAIKLHRFAGLFGFMVQMVNDNIDGIALSTGSKLPEDAFSDLRNKNITAPLFCFLTKQQEKHTRIGVILESQNADGVMFEPKVTVRNGRRTKPLHHSLEASVRKELEPMLKQYCIPAAKRVGDMVQQEVDRDLSAGAILADMAGITEANRFYHQISPEQQAPTESSRPVEALTRTGLLSTLSAIFTRKGKILHTARAAVA